MRDSGEVVSEDEEEELSRGEESVDVCDDVDDVEGYSCVEVPHCLVVRMSLSIRAKGKSISHRQHFQWYDNFHNC